MNMAIEDALSIIRQSVGLVALWCLYMAWRWYRTEALRDDLFAVRDRLFDFAASGAIEFDNPAYRRLWLVLNALIHFSNRITFARFVLPGLLTPVVNNDIAGYVAWRRSLDNVPQETRERLVQIHSDLALAVARHLLRRSIPFMPITAAVRIAQLLGRELPRFKNRCIQWLEARVPALEAQALDAEQQRTRWRKRRGQALAA